jgi:hypothetical protein
LGDDYIQLRRQWLNLAHNHPIAEGMLAFYEHGWQTARIYRRRKLSQRRSFLWPLLQHARTLPYRQPDRPKASAPN